MTSTQKHKIHSWWTTTEVSWINQPRKGVQKWKPKKEADPKKQKQLKKN